MSGTVNPAELARGGRAAVVVPAAGALLGVLLGVASGAGFRATLPPTPDGVPVAPLAVSYVLHLATWAFALGLLPGGAAAGRAPCLRAWALAALWSGAAYLGSAATGVWAGTGNMGLRCWGLGICVTAVLCGGVALLRLLLPNLPGAVKQAACAAVLCSVSVLFWSRGPIQAAGDAERSGRLAAAAMTLSGPLLLSADWQQAHYATVESGAAARFDLLRAPLTYDVWLGSYQAVAYPQVWPATQRGADGANVFAPGVAPVLLLLGLAGLLLAEARLLLRARVNPD